MGITQFKWKKGYNAWRQILMPKWVIDFLFCLQSLISLLSPGNSWGCGTDGNCCVGCGPQEEFRGCSDVSITALDGNTGPTTTSTTTTTTTTAPTTTTTIGGAQVPTCEAVPPYHNNPGMHDWCVTNCLAPIPYCPASHCLCTP